MIFILLTFLAAFAIEGLGTLVSVIGLSTLFGANPIIIALAIALDAGKLVVVTLLYSYWSKLGKLMKSYALIAATITMIITSAGAAGYLSGEFQKAIMGTQEIGLKVDVLKQEQAKLEERKKQIDNSIAAIPDRYTANQKIRLMNQFKAEQKQVTDRLNELSRELPKLQVDQIGVEAKAGPILYIAKAFDISVESAVKWVILMIIFVFDPLAVFLIIAGNFLLHQRRLHKETKVGDADLFAEPKAALPDDVAPKLVVPTFNDGLDSDANAPIGSPEWDRAMAGIDEPGVGNSAVKFEKQIAAMPPELRNWNTLQPVTPVAPPVEPVVEPSEPVFEELQATPDVADDGAWVKTYDDTQHPTERGVEEDEPAREVIRLEDVTRPVAGGVYQSSLNSVRADETLTFEESPRDAISSNHYRNLR